MAARRELLERKRDLLLQRKSLLEQGEVTQAPVEPEVAQELPAEIQQFAQAQGVVPSAGEELAPPIDQTRALTPQPRQELPPEQEALVRESEQEGYRILGAAAFNTPASTLQFVDDISRIVREPIQTAKSLASLGSGLVELLIPGEQGNENTVRAMGGFLKDRYGSVEDALGTLEDDPVGFLSDVSVLLSGGGMLASKVGRLSTVGKNLQTFGHIVDPVGGVGFAVNKAITGRTPVNSLVKTALDLPKKKGIVRIDDLANAFLSKGLNVKRKSLKILDNDMRKVKDSINRIVDGKTKDGVRIRTADIVDSLDDLIENAGKEGLNLRDLRSINRARSDFAELHGAVLTPRQVQDIKVGFNKGFKPDLSSRAGQVQAKINNKLRATAKLQLEELHPELKALNANEGVMIELSKAIEDRIIKLEKQPVVPVRGLIAGAIAGTVGGAGGDLLAGLKFGAAAIVADKIITSPRIQIGVAKAINKHNQALAKAGKLSVVTRPAFQAGRAERIIQETP